MTTPEIVKKLRKTVNLTQVEMAKKIGVAQSRISEYERGKVSITLETLKYYSEKLGVEFEIIFKF